MSRRLLLVLAVGAALVGAPSRASAASNVLLGGQVSPATGTTSTTFTFSVRYDGRFPATAVTASAGAVTISLARIAGTAEDGTWRGSSRLPAGTWPVAFAAVAAQGNAASLTGPTVAVLPDAPVTAAPSPRPAPPSSGGTAIDAGASDVGATTGSPPPAAPGESAAAAGASMDAAPMPTATPASLGAPGPASGQAGGDPTSGAEAPDARPDASAAAPPTTEGDAPARAPAASPAASPALSIPRGSTTDPGGLALVLGLGGLALIAVSGSGLLLAAARRRRAATSDGLVAEEAASVLQQRTLRRARVRLEEDPIVAGMGLPDAAGAAERRARRAAKRRGVR